MTTVEQSAKLDTKDFEQLEEIKLPYVTNKKKVDMIEVVEEQLFEKDHRLFKSAEVTDQD